MGIRKTPLAFPQCGSNIRKYRKLRNYSIAQLAQYIDINPKHLSNLESGRQMASIKTLYRLSVILNVPIEKLLVEDENESINTSKDYIIDELSGLTDIECDSVYEFICHIIPLTRKFREY